MNNEKTITVTTIEEMKDKLISLPDKIAEQKKKVHALENKQRNLDENISFIKNGIAKEIFAEKTPEGKNVYSNIEMREAELKSRSRNNNQLTALYSEHQNLAESIFEDRTELEKLEQEFKVIKYIFLLESNHETIIINRG